MARIELADCETCGHFCDCGRTDARDRIILTALERYEAELFDAVAELEARLGPVEIAGESFIDWAEAYIGGRA